MEEVLFEWWGGKAAKVGISRGGVVCCVSISMLIGELIMLSIQIVLLL